MLPKELKPYRNVIESLKYSHNAPNIKSLIEQQLGATATGPLVFHIRGELNRLAKQSAKPFRINQHFPDLNYTVFEHGKTTHHLDAVCLPEFMRTLEKYGGIYTVGVEEHMDAFLKKESDRIAHYHNMNNMDVKPINVSERVYRSEERMHLGVRASVYFLPKTQVQFDNFTSDIKKIEAKEVVTQNISTSGLRVKSECAADTGAMLVVRLKGLDDEYIISQPFVLYQCMRCDAVGEDKFEWALKKIEHPYHKEFDLFTRRLIDANRGRYRVDLKNVERSVVHHISEQFITNRQEELTIFFTQGMGMSPYCFGSNLSREILEFFEDEQKRTLLPSAIKKDSIVEKSMGKTALWVTIVQKNSTCFSTVIDEKSSKDIAFLHYALSRPDAKIFQVSTSRVDSDYAFVSHSLPVNTSAGKRANRKRRLIDYYSPGTKELVSGLGFATTIKELSKGLLSHLLEVTPGISKSQQEAFSKLASRNKHAAGTLNFICARGRELRREDRFNHTGKVSIESRNETLAGRSVDISESGVKIKQETPGRLLKNEVVKVTFHDLPVIRDKAPSGRYRVIHDPVDGFLRLFSEPGLKMGGHEYMALYLDKFFNHLDPVNEQDREGAELLGLERALRNLQNSVQPYTKAIMQFHRDRTTTSSQQRVVQGYPTPTHINIGYASQEPFADLMGEAHEASGFAKQMLCQLELQRCLGADFRDINIENPFVRHLFMIAVDESGSVREQKIIDEGEAPSPLMMQGITRTYRRRGWRTHWYQMDVTRKSRVFERYYREELDYIGSIAPHRATALTDLVKHTRGVISLTPLDSVVNTFSPETKKKDAA